MPPVGHSTGRGAPDRALGSFWAYRAEVQVGRGTQRVAVVVTDEIAGTVSTLTATVERPAE